MTEPRHIGDLKPDNRNARRHTPRNLGMIEESLRRGGAGRSILIDEDYKILAGNGVVEAAASAGIEKLRVIEADGDEIIAVRRSNLTEDQKIEMALFDNRTAELAAWNTDVLRELADEVDLSSMWFDDELGRVLDGPDELPEPSTGGTHDDGAEDEPEADDGSDVGTGELLKLVDITISEPRHQVNYGDRWRVGSHLLVCAKVSSDHDLWRHDLDGDVLFCPYPGPFTPLTIRAETTRLVMVQPNAYIAGHILDRYAEIKGEDAVVHES